ncbi:MAG: RNA methyltransferase [Gammaproteobacteria bacterium]|nr:RNA methyltransferase [Gammaproteobacteria bacterium]
MRDEENDPPRTDPALADAVRLVMVEPTHPGNIGAACRAMKNMGLHRLVLVNPLRHPDPEARFRAASALDVLDGARVVDTLAEAIDDCTLVIGASARSRRLPWPMVTPREAGRRVIEEASSGPVALLFGRESSGLTNEELARCQLHLHIPSDPGYPSLNVSMAMQLVAYEVRMAWLDAGERLPEPPWDRPWADSAAVEGMLAHLDSVLEATGFLDLRDPGLVPMRLRRLFFRTRLDQVEVNILRGLCGRIERIVEQGGVVRRHRPDPGGIEDPAEPGGPASGQS